MAFNPLQISPEFLAAQGAPVLQQPTMQIPAGMYQGNGMPATTGANLQLNPNGASPNTIFGMSPAMFASIAGQAGAAISPKDSWGSRLGTSAANMGGQQLQQIANQEAEKRQMAFYRDLFKGKTPAEVAAIQKDLQDPNTGGGIGHPSTPTEIANLTSKTPADVGDISKQFGLNVTAPQNSLKIPSPNDFYAMSQIIGGGKR